MNEVVVEASWQVEEQEEWQAYFRQCDDRFLAYWVEYVQEHQREYKVLDFDKDNILDAFQSAFEQGVQSTLLVQGVNAFYSFLAVRGLYGPAEVHLNRAAQAARFLGDLVGLATTRLHQGLIAKGQYDDEQAKEHFLTGLNIAYSIEQPEVISRLLRELGGLAFEDGDYVRAEAYLQEGLTVARQIDDHDTICDLLQTLGLTTFLQGEYTQAEVYLQEGLSIARTLADPLKITVLLNNLGWLASASGNVAQEKKYYLESLALARSVGSTRQVMSALSNLAAVEADHYGNYTQAEEFLLEGLALAREIGRHHASILLANLGGVAGYRGDYARAEAYLQEGLTLARKSGRPYPITGILNEWGQLQLKQQKFALASTAFRETLHIAQEAGIKEFVAKALYALAQVAFAQGDIASARQQGQQSLTIFEAIGHADVTEVKEWLAELGTAGSLKLAVM